MLRGSPLRLGRHREHGRGGAARRGSAPGGGGGALGARSFLIHDHLPPSMILSGPMYYLALEFLAQI